MILHQKGKANIKVTRIAGEINLNKTLDIFSLTNQNIFYIYF